LQETRAQRAETPAQTPAKRGVAGKSAAAD
jgi:hypothetical protein